jgi:hypothetical protein
MTLKEKFRDKILSFLSDNMKEQNALECENIADDFAIGFADWIRVCKLKGRPYDFDNIKELLEIYKKEKEL